MDERAIMQVEIIQELSNTNTLNGIIVFPQSVIYHKEYDHNKKESVVSSVTLVFAKSQYEVYHETLKLIDGKVHYNGKIYQGYSVSNDEEDKPMNDWDVDETEYETYDDFGYDEDEF